MQKGNIFSPLTLCLNEQKILNIKKLLASFELFQNKPMRKIKAGAKQHLYDEIHYKLNSVKIAIAIAGICLSVKNGYIISIFELNEIKINQTIITMVIHCVCKHNKYEGTIESV